MTISDWLIIAAVILGPILAIQVQKLLQMWKERRERKLSIFKTLMSTRGTTLSPTHVEALNMIDLEFSVKNQNEKAVLDAWKLYLDHLYDVPRNLPESNHQTKLDAWTLKSNECLIELLHKMSKAIGYGFDKVQLKKGSYTPQGYVDLELEQSLIRKGILLLLAGKIRLPEEPAQSNESGDT